MALDILYILSHSGIQFRPHLNLENADVSPLYSYLRVLDVQECSSEWDCYFGSLILHSPSLLNMFKLTLWPHDSSKASRLNESSKTNIHNACIFQRMLLPFLLVLETTSPYRKIMMHPCLWMKHKEGMIYGDNNDEPMRADYRLSRSTHNTWFMTQSAAC